MRLKAPAFWEADAGHPAARALSPLGAAYARVAAGRIARAVPTRAPVPVVCVGNVTLGGVGKTPFAILLARLAAERGLRPHFLTRGYGGRERGPLRVGPDHDASEVGDEALLLAEHAPAWASRDRPPGAAAAAGAGADLVVMDDGYQNPSLHKDLSFLLLDAGSPLGNGRVFPAGPLRERPEAALARADVIVAVGADADVRAPRLPGGTVPTLTAWLETDPSVLAGRDRVHAVAGIGRPDRFFAALRGHGVLVARGTALPDHHRFAPGEVAALAAAAEAEGCPLVTTRKDLMRMTPADRARVVALPAAMRCSDEDRLAEALVAAAS